MQQIIGGTSIRNARIAHQACHVTGCRKAFQFLLLVGFLINTCIKLSIKTGRKSTTPLRSNVIVKSAAAMSISLFISCPEEIAIFM